jgi:HSP20 family protein
MAMLSRHTSPFAELADMRERFDRLFEDFGEPGTRKPAMDVIEGDDALTIRAEIPGVSPDEIHLEVHNDVLTIRGEHEEAKEEKDQRFIRRERRATSFARSITLPPGSDPDAIEASYRNGLLEVRIPHARQDRPKEIPIKSVG